MIIYNYNKEYKYYINSGEADPSPLEPGVFLIPANATNIQPPECSESEIQIFEKVSQKRQEVSRENYPVILND